MGFKQSAHEVAVYRRGSECNILLVGVYVDDLIITGAKEQKVEVFKELMKKAFDMSDLRSTILAAPSRLGGGNHQDKQVNPTAKHEYQVPLDAITQAM